MNSTRTLDRLAGGAVPISARRSRGRWAAAAGVTLACAFALFASRPAAAVDGCLVLLCFAAPNWRGIPQCVPPITQVLHDLARGKPFPTCAMAGAGNSATHAWASAPGYCTAQYTRVFEGESGPLYACDYTGAVSVSIDGNLFSRIWWRLSGDSVTEFSSTAKARMGTWDTRFDDDYARWLASQPVSTPTPETGGV